ncbi:MAG: hypothetical protein JSV64_08165 [Candidatus Bathyarchaeota archaeon]|nr:MAG: hypothetical protein JSV64_08165 [Candidatus Bathyarchaeota archaeon]
MNKQTETLALEDDREDADSDQKSKLNRYSIVAAFLGLLGALNLFLISFYVLAVYLLLSRIDPMGQLFFQVYLSTALAISSAVALIYGSIIILKSRMRKGGLINLLSGTLVPVPTYFYFGVISEPRLLGWLGIQGYFLLIPAIMSGAISILLARYK